MHPNFCLKLRPVAIACVAVMTAVVPLAGQTQTKDKEIYLGEMKVTAPAVASKDALPETYSGGQVARGARLGVLGNTNVLDAPFEVTSYTSQKIEDQQDSTIAGVLYSDPSIRMSTSDGHTVENLMMRGLDVGSSNFAFNGMYGLLSNGHVNTFMIERVEVFKGPSAMISGISPSGEVGGVINLVPKRANDADLTRLTTTYESDLRFGFKADVSRRFGEEKRLGIHVNGNFASGERPVDDQKQYNRDVAVAIDYRGDQWKVEFDLYSTKQRNSHGLLGLFMVSSAGAVIKAPDATLNQNNGLFLNESIQGTSLRGEVDLSDNLTAYAAVGGMKDDFYGSRYSTHVMSIQPDGTGTVRAFLQDGRNSSYSAETGLRAHFDTGSVKHSLVASMSAYHDRTYHTMRINTATSNIYRPIGSVSYNPNATPWLTDSEKTFTSFSVADTMSFLDDRALLTMGLRQQRVRTTNLTNGAAYDEDAVTPAVGLVVKPWGPNVSLYANYIEGLSAGTTVNDPIYSNNGETLAPYKSKQAEVGVKWDSGSLMNTISLFQIKRPSLMAIDQGGSKPYYGYEGEQRNRGIEWNIAGEVTRSVRALGGVAYTKGKHTKSSTVKGMTAAGIPDWTATLGTDFDIPGVAGLAANGRVIYTGRQYLMTGSRLEVPSWTRYDVGTRYATKIADKNVVFRANVENLFNRAYWSGVFSTGVGLTTVGAPRTYKLSASIDL